MNRFKKSILSVLLLAALTLCVFALDGDYKNNLLKVDITKSSPDCYQVNLYTQKPYTNSIKVIKKSDTSYYILLPETYHSITSVPSGDDIRNVEVKLYPYAGQDLNNGYTKINITTAKPVSFTTGIRTASGAGAPKVDFEKLAKLDNVFAQSQKAGQAQVVAPTKPAVATPTKPAAVAPAQAPVVQKPAVEPVSVPSKPVAAAPVQAPVVQKPVTVAQKPVVTPVKVAETKVVSETPKAATVAIKPQGSPQAIQVQIPKVAQSTEAVKPLVKAAGNAKVASNQVKTVVIDVEQPDGQEAARPPKRQQVAMKEPVNQIEAISELAPEESLEPVDSSKEPSMDEEAQVQELEQLEPEEHAHPEANLVAKAKTALRIVYNKVLDNLFPIVAIAIVLLLLPLFAVVARKKKPQGEEPIVGIQRHKDILAHEPYVEAPEAPVAFEGYFEQGQQPQEAEMFTLQEESAEEELIYPAVEPVQEPAAQQPVYVAPPVEEPVAAAPQPVAQEVPADEAQILSHTEIAQGRGFYLARFEGSVSLIGYIGDEVFVIHTFDIEPSDNHIAWRLSEKSSEGDFYLVRVASSKMLVRSTLQALSLELLM